MTFSSLAVGCLFVNFHAVGYLSHLLPELIRSSGGRSVDAPQLLMCCSLTLCTPPPHENVFFIYVLKYFTFLKRPHCRFIFSSRLSSVSCGGGVFAATMQPPPPPPFYNAEDDGWSKITVVLLNHGQIIVSHFLPRFVPSLL